MYYNAWKNSQTTFMKHSNFGAGKSLEDMNNCEWSWVEVMRVVDQNGKDITANLRYEAVDDGNPLDETVLMLQLDDPIMPFETVQLNMEWQSKVPKIYIRTGYSKEFFFMVQWFPKVGVYEPAGTRFAKKGQWNCHQYHANTEYYADFGVYNVTMDVPENYVVGASGYETKKTIVNGRKKVTYLAEDVIDFAWTANPHFKVIEDNWRDTKICLLIQDEHICNKDRFLESTKNTLDFYAEYLEPYPYLSLTIVSPPYHGLFAGAMEYPTLFTAPTLCDLPEGIKTTETLSIHELTHQWFMQMVATNEQEEAWMDEGFTAYFEAKILDKYYDHGTICLPTIGVQVGAKELRRGRYMGGANVKSGPLSTISYQFKRPSYREITYGKGALMLFTLEGLVGEKVMQEVIKTYFNRWKFKHPGRQDFIDVVNEVVPAYRKEQYGMDMNWFFDQVIYGTDICEYSVGNISNRKSYAAAGYLNSIDECTPPTTEYEQVIYDSRVTFYRNGGLKIPQEILVNFDDGTSSTIIWDGEERMTTFELTSPKRIISAALDPQRKIYIEHNFLNNSKTIQPDQTGITRYRNSFMTWFQQAMQTVSGLI